MREGKRDRESGRAGGSNERLVAFGSEVWLGPEKTFLHGVVLLSKTARRVSRLVPQASKAVSFVVRLKV